MNSLKNTVVIVLLLGVSYGVFQLVNAPEPNVANEKEPEEIEIIDEAPNETQIADNTPLPDASLRNELPLPDGGSTQLPPPLLDQTPKTEQKYPNGLSVAPDIPSQPKMGLPKMTDPPSNSLGSNSKGPAFSGPLDQGNFAPPSGSATKQQPFASTGDLKTVPQKSNQNLLADNTQNFPNNQGFQNSTQPQTKIVPTAQELESAWPKVRQMVSQRDFSSALKMLSRFYHTDLDQGQRVELLNWLDSLAGKVVYSNNFHIDGQAYLVRDGDTLQSLAQQWKVPQRLIYKINESVITNPDFLIAGTQLKKVQGPFRAEVAVGQKEMTMFVGEMYAGRFPLEFGNDQPITVGDYQVRRKSDRGQTYQDRSGQSVAAGSQFNPYGKYWIDLGNGLCIHSANTNDGRGCIRVRHNEVANVFDAADVFGILSENSQVTIRR